MVLISNRDLLKRVPLFSSLTEAQISVLEGAFTKKKFSRNTLIFQQGQRSDAFFVILVGRAHVVTKDDRGREVIFAILNQGDHFGEMSLIDGEPHSTSVKTVIPTEVLMLEREAFEFCLPTPHSLQHSVMLNLVQRLRAADRKIEFLALMKAEERIIHFLKELARPDEEGNMVIQERISSTHVGKSVGTSREMVTRVIKRLRDDGMIVMRPDGSCSIK
jgi:CRP/FNR family cyclic AMP-dependent transcriptional regulator